MASIAHGWHAERKAPAELFGSSHAWCILQVWGCLHESNVEDTLSLGTLAIARPSRRDFRNSLPPPNASKTWAVPPELPCGGAPLAAQWLSTPGPPLGRDRSCC